MSVKVLELACEKFGIPCSEVRKIDENHYVIGFNACYDPGYNKVKQLSKFLGCDCRIGGCAEAAETYISVYLDRPYTRFTSEYKLLRDTIEKLRTENEQLKLELSLVI